MTQENKYLQWMEEYFYHDDGDAILIVNYYDFDDCLIHTIYCDRIDAITKEMEE